MSETTSADPAPPAAAGFGKPGGGLRLRLYTIIFEADTSAGKHFDVLLVAAILLSIVVVVVDSVPSVQAPYGHHLNLIEWAFTLLFTAE